MMILSADLHNVVECIQYGVNVKHQEYFADNPSTGIDPTSRDE